MANINTITERYSLSHSQVKIGKNIMVQIKSYLSVEEFASAVRSVADACFTNGEYTPEFKEVAKRYMLLTTFTDIEFDDMSLEEIFKVTQNDWYFIIENEVTQLPIYSEILNAVDETIEYKIRTRKTAFDFLCDTVYSNSDTINATKTSVEFTNLYKYDNGKEIVYTVTEGDYTHSDKYTTTTAYGVKTDATGAEVENKGEVIVFGHDRTL